ncbi:MAG TPA: hypothetical protein VEV17_14755 [Bryobacteraceae bacterium]|nr:hypothetical protein [Bryobacteraceae bacterium]
MATSEWQELLGHGGIRNLSRRDVMGQATGSSALPAGYAGPFDLSQISGATGGGGEVVNNALPGPGKDATEQLSSLVTQISSLNSTQQTQISATQDNTQAVTQNTVSKGSSGESIGSQIGRAAESLFGGALSLSPIVSGLLSLFGGGSTTPAPAPRFTLPASVQYQAGLTASSGAVAPVSYAETGQPRPQAPAQPAQVTVQVSAMDSQSFLDHSEDIARAVRDALLNSNSLGDVISDL